MVQISLLIISFNDFNFSVESCNNYILCKVSASSNQTMDDFPDKDDGLRPPSDNVPDDTPDRERVKDGTDKDRVIIRDDTPRDDAPRTYPRQRWQKR